MIPSSSSTSRRFSPAGPVARWSIIALAAALIAGLIWPATARAAGSRLVVDTRPAAPIHVQATTHITDRTPAGKTASALVSWSPPETQQGPPISQYVVSAYINGEKFATPLATVLPTSCATVDGTTTCATIIPNIMPGTTYAFVVQAQNSLGLSAESSRAHTVTWTPGESAPAAPTNIQITSGVDSAAVHWTPPYDGGNPIDGYEISVYAGSSRHILSWVAARGGTTGTTITKLDPGGQYSFSVRAVNAHGWGPESVRSRVIGAISTPDAPSDVTAQAARYSATVSWTAPFDGGSPITEYIVKAYYGYSSDVASEIDTVGGSIRSVTFRGVDRPALQIGVAYTFTVTAINAAGAGPESQRSNQVIPALLPPDAPAKVTASAGIGSATVTWSPAFDHGSPVQGYIVRAYLAGTRDYAGGLSTRADATSATINDLAGGRSYVFTVNAVNAAGYGPESAPSNPVTLATVPAPPVAVRATAAVHTATVAWSAPYDGGSPITSYAVTALRPDGSQVATLTLTGAATSVTFFTLTDGSAYSFQVVASNAIGASTPATALYPVTLPAPAGAPRNLTVTAGDGSAQASWNPPATDGGSGITDYEVSASDGVHTPLVLHTTSTSATVTGLSNDTTYTVSAQAINGVGTGDAASATVTPRNLPPALQVPVAQSGRYGDSLSFDVSASDPEAADHLALSADGLPAGLTFTDHGNGTGAVSGTLQAAAGDYTITIAVSDGRHAPVTRTVALTVSRADAQVTPLPTNPAAVRTSGSSGSVTLRSEINASTSGSIANAAPVNYTLTSLDSGASFHCSAGTSATGNTVTATCRLDRLPVDLYQVHVAIGGSYYQGSAESLLTVYRPTRGSISSYGGLRHGDLLDSFKLQAKYGKKGNATGFLLFVEHRGSHDVTLKSTGLTGLVIKKGRAYLQGTATLDGVGGYHFAAAVSRGSSNRFSLWLTDTHHQVVTDLSFGPATITSGRTQIARG